MEKPNCYDCKYRGGVPGSAHSSCQHPDIDPINPWVEILAIMRTPVATPASVKLNIIGTSHGIKNGWFCWPFNFDPIWLENCDGFKKKE